MMCMCVSAVFADCVGEEGQFIVRYMVIMSCIYVLYVEGKIEEIQIYFPHVLSSLALFYF